MTDALKPEDTRDALRKIGVLLLGIGVAMLWMRKSSDWSEFVNFVILAIPAILFYGGAVYTLKDTGGLQPWQAVASVFGLFFVPFALSSFVDWVGGNPGADLNVFWIFALTAGLAAYAGLVTGVRFQLLAAALAAIVSWTALWDKILGDEGISGHIAVYRGLLGILAILILLAAVQIWRSDRREGLEKASELLTGAGVAAVIACSLGITSAFGPFIDFFGVGHIGTNALWDILLLVISIGLVGIGSRIGKRGPVYVGGIGLLFFLVIVGQDLGDSSPEPEKVGWWPPILLFLGGAAIAASLQKGATLGKRPREIVKRISTH
jgi:hypothetical protein